MIDIRQRTELILREMDLASTDDGRFLVLERHVEALLECAKQLGKPVRCCKHPKAERQFDPHMHVWTDCCEHGADCRRGPPDGSPDHRGAPRAANAVALDRVADRMGSSSPPVGERRPGDTFNGDYD